MTLEIWRYTEGTDELGNAVKNWALYKTITGVIDGLDGDEQQVAGAPGVVATHLLFCDPVDIMEKDQVRYNGRVFEVAWVDDPMNYGEFLQVLLREVK